MNSLTSLGSNCTSVVVVFITLLTITFLLHYAYKKIAWLSFDYLCLQSTNSSSYARVSKGEEFQVCKLSKHHIIIKRGRKETKRVERGWQQHWDHHWGGLMFKGFDLCVNNNLISSHHSLLVIYNIKWMVIVQCP